jgi:hypothetical protein
MHTRVLRSWIVGLFLFALGLLSLPAAENVFVLKEPRDYEFHDIQGKYEFSTGVVIYPKPNGKFAIGGNLYRTPGKAIDFGGTGTLGKDGKIHFAWEDSFEKKGNGTLRFIKGGKQLVLQMEADEYEWTLTWTEDPVEQDVRTQPGGYTIHLPSEYKGDAQSGDLKTHVFLILKPLKNNRVAVSGFTDIGDQLLNFDGEGAWKTGDQIAFSIQYEKLKGTGIIHFTSAKQVVLSLSYTSPLDSKQSAIVNILNQGKPPLTLSEDH